MTHESVQPATTSIKAELERLAYYAYLLTRDPDSAVLAVMTALSSSANELTGQTDLQGRTVEIALLNLPDEPADRENPAPHPKPCLETTVADSKRLTSWKEDLDGSPIFSLDSRDRIAFVLHHVIGYSIEDAALLLEMTETEFRAHLRSAYLQLASGQIEPEVHLVEPAFA